MSRNPLIFPQSMIGSFESDSLDFIDHATGHGTSHIQFKSRLKLMCSHLASFSWKSSTNRLKSFGFLAAQISQVLRIIVYVYGECIVRSLVRRMS